MTERLCGGRKTVREVRGLHMLPVPLPDSPELLGGGGPSRPGRVHRRLPGRGWLCGNPGNSTHPVLSPGGAGAQAGGPGAWARAGAAGAGAPSGGGAAPAGGAAGAELPGSGALPGRGVHTAALLTGPGPVTCLAPPGPHRVRGPTASFPLPAWPWSLAQGGPRREPSPSPPPSLPPAAPPTSGPLLVPGCSLAFSLPVWGCPPEQARWLLHPQCPWLWLVCPQGTLSLVLFPMVTVHDASLLLARWGPM